MRPSIALLCILTTTTSMVAQPYQANESNQKAASKSRPAETASAHAPAAQALPVRQVILYKNGIGYFEHTGEVSGNQHVAIDFTSSQLNDVLQSLTVLDENGGRIGGVNYNSTTPLAEQLKSLSLAMDDDPTSQELFNALRGQRIEVTGAPGGSITGRLMSIELKPQRVGGSPINADTNDSTSTILERAYLTIVATSGAVRVIELTPTLSVRPLDPSLQGQLDRYLELLSTNHATGLRHLTLDALGQGQRQLRVSYISEVPVWKSTYRLVFPKDSTDSAILQGWAVVDNTIGSDWDNVQLSLVAGAPQSFIQPLSQPLYVRRPEVAISTTAQTTPQTHEATEQAEMPPPPPQPSPSAPMAMAMRSQSYASKMKAGSASQSVTSADEVAVGHGSGSGLGPGTGGNIGGGIYDATNAIQDGDVTTAKFDDFFQYKLAQPVTIHKNESAMVPILQEKLPAERVTLWSPSESTPFRAIWLENSSKLTFDRGSFSIFESGVFAGQGLLDPIHPGEKRLLSYAADQAVHVRPQPEESKRALRQVTIKPRGMITERYAAESRTTYNASNSADEPRVVVIEVPRQANRTLSPDSKAAETAATLYRFRLPVPAHQSASVLVADEGLDSQTFYLNADQDQTDAIAYILREAPELAAKLNPILDAEKSIAEMKSQLADLERKHQELTQEEARSRENLTALKGNEGSKRFVDELNRTEDQLEQNRQQKEALQAKEKSAVDALRQTLLTFTAEWQSPNWNPPPK